MGYHLLCKILRLHRYHLEYIQRQLPRETYRKGMSIALKEIGHFMMLMGPRNQPPFAEYPGEENRSASKSPVPFLSSVTIQPCEVAAAGDDGMHSSPCGSQGRAAGKKMLNYKIPLRPADDEEEEEEKRNWRNERPCPEARTVAEKKNVKDSGATPKGKGVRKKGQ